MKIRDGGGIQESVGERGLFRPMIAPPPTSCRTTPQPYQLAQSPFATFLSLSFLSFSLISFSAWLFMISCEQEDVRQVEGELFAREREDLVHYRSEHAQFLRFSDNAHLVKLSEEEEAKTGDEEQKHGEDHAIQEPRRRHELHGWASRRRRRTAAKAGE